MEQKTGTVVCDNCGKTVTYSVNKDIDRFPCPWCEETMLTLDG